MRSNMCKHNKHTRVINLNCKVPAEPYGEPVDDLNHRDKADSKAETAEPSKAGDEVEPRHLGRALELCKTGKISIFLCEGT